jgi:hypothetical protein
VHVCLNFASPSSLLPRADNLQLSSLLFCNFGALIMAGKEATAYILDFGESMGEKRHGRDVSDLEWAMEYVWDKITTTVSVHL